MEKLIIGQKLSKIQQEFKSKKSRFNSFGKYNFRSAEDILEGLKPLEEKYEVYFKINEEVREVFDLVILESVASIVDAEDGSEISAKSVVAVDLSQKGMQMPQKFGSASSYAKKYSLGNLLLIDDTQDADASNKGETTRKTAKIPLEVGQLEYDKALAHVVDRKTYNQVVSKYAPSEEANKFLLMKLNEQNE